VSVEELDRHRAERKKKKNLESAVEYANIPAT